MSPDGIYCKIIEYEISWPCDINDTSKFLKGSNPKGNNHKGNKDAQKKN